MPRVNSEFDRGIALRQLEGGERDPFPFERIAQFAETGRVLQRYDNGQAIRDVVSGANKLLGVFW